MQTKSTITRQTVDLSGYPDLVVIYLGMKVRKPGGLLTLLRFGPNISRAVAAKPDGLLAHEPIFYSIFPLHVGMRQYWRDFDTLETWARSLPHHKWWQDFGRNTGGTAFWHEAYSVRGGMEAVYVDVDAPLGFTRFAPAEKPEGSMFSARKRLQRKEKERS
jgi:fumigallin biosynthesis monooxygenase-like protein